MDSKLHKKLSDRQEKGTLRSLSSFEGSIDFFSNDYLGWAQEPISFEGKSGGTGSRLISGNSISNETSESKIAQFFMAESALMFNSGYDANLGVFSSVPQKGDVVLYDAHIHASVRDGLRMGNATTYAFRHNDVDHLKERLEKIGSEVVYVVVESLYSMHGDIAYLDEIEALCAAYGAYLIVDEAHACGVFGANGRGLFTPSRPEMSIRIVTFGKAFGSHGACVLSSASFRNYLVNFARSFMYTTALPAYVFEHNTRVLDRAEGETRREELTKVIQYFRSQMLEFDLPSNEKSPIQIFPIGTVDATLEKAERLQAANLAVKPIFSPTVPVGEECLRVCLHAFNTFEEIDQLVAQLKA